MFVINISTSASDRFNQLLNGTLDVSTRAPDDSTVVRARTDASASSYGITWMPCSRAVSHANAIEMMRRSPGARCNEHCTDVGVSDTGAGSQ